MFTQTFPYDIGTFVRVNDNGRGELPSPKSIIGHGDLGDIGTISCYQCVTDEEDDYCVMVSGYKQSWCGEYLLQEIRPLSPEEIQYVVSHYESLMNTDDNDGGVN